MLADKLIRAITYATKKHEGQVRKVDGAPYIVHPYRVAMLLKEEGYEDDIVIAGLLHDVVEDTDGTIGEISNLFGHHIAQLVSFATEPDKTKPWEDRKKHTIHQLKEAPLEARLVVCADKIDNLRAIIENEQALGDGIWEHFNSSKQAQQWYYQEVYKSLKTNLSSTSTPALFTQLEQLIDQFK